MVTLETFISLTSKPPPRMATANKIAPNMNDIVCNVIAGLTANMFLVMGIADCCARAATGQAAAPPSSVANNFRRPMWLAM
jgi:hypothetical protein